MIIICYNNRYKTYQENKMTVTELKNTINNGEFDEKFQLLYSKENIPAARERYLNAVFEFEKIFGSEGSVSVFSVPGRSEISGNHTDHNHGKVIAASVDLDIIAIARRTDGNTVRVKSAGFDMDTVEINVRDGYERFTSCALIAGVIDGLEKRGFEICGFDAYTTSNVFKGSGLSSSAAFENMIGTILNHFSNDGKIDFVTISQISQYAENVFFGKPSGLMDQIACAAGGFVGIDFEDPTEPVVKTIDFDLTKEGYSLAIVNTGGNHANLNDEYAAITVEMKKICKFFGKSYLRELTKEDVLNNVTALRASCGDRAILRALHFFNENQRVEKQLKALENKDLGTFFENVTASGRSSLQMLQNIFCCASPEDQGLTLALSLCPEILDERCVWRVHGGGFAGTILVFVPQDTVNKFKTDIEKFFGDGSCFILKVRTVGAVCLSK